MTRITKATFLTVVLFITSVLGVFAQSEGECGTYQDADLNCPLDTWVMCFAAIALILTSAYLYRRQRLAGKQ